MLCRREVSHARHAAVAPGLAEGVRDAFVEGHKHASKAAKER